MSVWFSSNNALSFAESSLQVFNDKKYLDAAERAAALVWREGLSKKGLGLCHGVSGNGYLMLRLAAITESATCVSCHLQ